MLAKKYSKKVSSHAMKGYINFMTLNFIASIFLVPKAVRV